MFKNLPFDLNVQIFLFDRTKVDSLDKVIHQIKFIPVLHHLEMCYELGGENWKEELLEFYGQYRTNEDWLIELNRRMKWRQYWDKKWGRME